jgi:hypothetical protein
MTDERHRNESAGLGDVLRCYVSHHGILIYLVPNVVLLAWLAMTPTSAHLLWLLAGFVVFLPQEHLTHVYILHFKPPRNKTSFRFLYRAHYGHHEFPKRLDLMWIPVWLTLPLLIVNLAVFAPFIKDVGNILAFVCGLFSGYLMFEWCHLLCHVPLRLRWRPLVSMRKRHLWHHYRNEHYWFSVQHLSWWFDSLWKTEGTPDSVPSSTTSFSLGVDHADPRAEEARAFFAERTSGDAERSRIWL